MIFLTDPASSLNIATHSSRAASSIIGQTAGVENNDNIEKCCCVYGQYRIHYERRRRLPGQPNCGF